MLAIEGKANDCVTVLVKAGAEINTALLAEDASKYFMYANHGGKHQFL